MTIDSKWLPYQEVERVGYFIYANGIYMCKEDLIDILIEDYGWNVRGHRLRTPIGRFLSDNVDGKLPDYDIMVEFVKASEEDWIVHNIIRRMHRIEYYGEEYRKLERMLG